MCEGSGTSSGLRLFVRGGAAPTFVDLLVSAVVCILATILETSTNSRCRYLPLPDAALSHPFADPETVDDFRAHFV